MLDGSLKETILLGNFYSKEDLLAGNLWILTSRENSNGIKSNFLAGEAKLYNRACWQQKPILLCLLVLRNG